ncbi:uncharacterized protein N7483_012470 [Penicillium malachiteum]|uniref:uncharacterized protein n=1 Tax=Penicillium malachiteum TaxID=1324776 RepID=UPI002546C6EB|nr:uncharacterized protein N7483_012470 [Penicillium malachiteum]KAJ5715289.1 hypothetical protein N7483_012470 [Penicillium malachiteum]
MPGAIVAGEQVTSWLSPEEKQFLIGRQRFARFDENNRGEMVKEQDGFSWNAARSAFRSFHTYAVAAIEFTVAVVVYGISFVLPTIVEDLGYSDVKAQAMTAPPYVFACIVTILSGVAADRYRTRMLSVAVPNIMAVVGFIVIIACVRYSSVSGVTYFGIFLMAGGLYPISPAVMAWTALNMAGSMKRAVGMALMMSISQLGGIVGSNIFITSEAPTYPVGFGIGLGMLVVFGVIWPVIYYCILKQTNARRASIPEQEVLARYTYQQLAAMGDESPLFRYAL